LKWRVTFVVEVEADSHDQAYSEAATAVEGFPREGVEVNYTVVPAGEIGVGTVPITIE